MSCEKINIFENLDYLNDVGKRSYKIIYNDLTNPEHIYFNINENDKDCEYFIDFEIAYEVSYKDIIEYAENNNILCKDVIQKLYINFTIEKSLFTDNTTNPNIITEQRNLDFLGRENSFLTNSFNNNKFSISLYGTESEKCEFFDKLKLELGVDCEELNYNIFDYKWKRFLVPINKGLYQEEIAGEDYEYKYNIGFEFIEFDTIPVKLHIDNIKVIKRCFDLKTETIVISDNPGFELKKVCDNKKSWTRVDYIDKETEIVHDLDNELELSENHSQFQLSSNTLQVINGNKEYTGDFTITETKDIATIVNNNNRNRIKINNSGFYKVDLMITDNDIITNFSNNKTNKLFITNGVKKIYEKDLSGNVTNGIVNISINLFLNKDDLLLLYITAPLETGQSNGLVSFDLKITEYFNRRQYNDRSYYLGNSREIINSKELTLEYNIAETIECDVSAYLKEVNLTPESNNLILFVTDNNSVNDYNDDHLKYVNHLAEATYSKLQEETSVFYKNNVDIMVAVRDGIIGSNGNILDEYVFNYARVIREIYTQPTYSDIINNTNPGLYVSNNDDINKEVDNLIIIFISSPTNQYAYGGVDLSVTTPNSDEYFNKNSIYDDNTRFINHLQELINAKTDHIKPSTLIIDNKLILGKDNDLYNIISDIDIKQAIKGDIYNDIDIRRNTYFETPTRDYKVLKERNIYKNKLVNDVYVNYYNSTNNIYGLKDLDVFLLKDTTFQNEHPIGINYTNALNNNFSYIKPHNSDSFYKYIKSIKTVNNSPYYRI